jgi:hypothetical protein
MGAVCSHGWYFLVLTVELFFRTFFFAVICPCSAAAGFEPLFSLLGGRVLHQPRYRCFLRVDVFFFLLLPFRYLARLLFMFIDSSVALMFAYQIRRTK